MPSAGLGAGTVGFVRVKVNVAGGRSHSPDPATRPAPPRRASGSDSDARGSIDQHCFSRAAALGCRGVGVSGCLSPSPDLHPALGVPQRTGS